MAMGVGLLVITTAMYGYGEYERVQFERGQAVRDRIEAATATTVALEGTVVAANERAQATATAAFDATGTAVATRQPPAIAVVGTPIPTATRPPPTATPTPIPVVIRRVVSKSIELDAPVVESKIENGEWEVPKFVAGHLEGTALPGAGSNIVLSGHVQSISSGNVFANIEKLKVGDEVVLRTNVGDVTYRIEGRNIVKNDDISVVQPSKREELTLITCTGTWNPLTRDYSHRWVIWGVRAA
jgi:LPXTG-site transpeptidase (sortase) family protein